MEQNLRDVFETFQDHSVHWAFSGTAESHEDWQVLVVDCGFKFPGKGLYVCEALGHIHIYIKL